jgi:hypothetical protein
VLADATGAKKRRKKKTSTLVALVVPAFEHAANKEAPFDLKTLSARWRGVEGRVEGGCGPLGDVSPFQCAQCPEAHGPTNYAKWWSHAAAAEDANPNPNELSKPTTYQVQHQFKYEPYVAIRVPFADPIDRPTEWFDPRFVGYGKKF